MRRMMAVSVVCALLAGCDYTVPLVKTANLPIDPAVVGLWQGVGGDSGGDRLLVLPLNKKEYLVVYPAGSKDAMFARGCLWRDGGAVLVQLDWFGTAQGKVPDDNRTFQYAAYTVESDTLTCRLLNPETVRSDIASPADLAKAIAANKGDPKLFREKKVFQKVKK